MPRIVDKLKMPVTFLGDSEWGSWKDGIAGKIQAVKPYVGLRILPWSLSSNKNNVRYFLKKYARLFHGKPDLISYVSYRTLQSAVAAVKKYGASCSPITKQCVLKAYRKALLHDPRWFRSENYYIYKLDAKGERYYKTLPPISGKQPC